MAKPKLNFVWIGEPRFTKGGQDIVGPVTIDQNFKHFAAETKEEANPMVFWCLAEHRPAYLAYFKEKGISIEVNAIEPYLSECKTEEGSEAEVAKIFSELLSPERNQTVDRVYLKDLFFNFLLAAQGDYVLDTNVQAGLETAIKFPAYSKFMFPWVDVPEVWMQYAPPGSRSRAKATLACYLAHFREAAKIFSEKGYSPDYHQYIGKAAVSALCLEKVPKLFRSRRDYSTADCDTWECGPFRGLEVDVIGLNIHKEYSNSHREHREQAYGAPHAHVLLGKLSKLTFDLDHGVDPDLTANPRSAVETSLNYDADKETLLHLATRYSALPEQRSCAVLLLRRGADVNREHPLTQRLRGELVTKVKSPLVYTIESRNEEAVLLLFTHAAMPVKLDQILNKETPLMTAVRCGNAVALLLEKGANANQAYETETQINTPLAMAVRDRKVELVALLLKTGKANPNLAIKNETAGFTQVISEPPLHIALKNRDSKTVQLLLDHGANPQAMAEYRSLGKTLRQRADEVETSDECRSLLRAALQKEEKSLSTTAAVMQITQEITAPKKENHPKGMESCQLEWSDGELTRIYLRYHLDGLISDEEEKALAGRQGSLLFSSEIELDTLVVQLKTAQPLEERLREVCEAELHLDEPIAQIRREETNLKSSNLDRMPLDHLSLALKTLQEKGYLSEALAEKILKIRLPRKPLIAVPSPVQGESVPTNAGFAFR